MSGRRALVVLAALLLCYGALAPLTGAPGNPTDSGVADRSPGRSASPTDVAGSTTERTVSPGRRSGTTRDRGLVNFSTDPVVVAVRNRADPGRNVTAAVEEAIAYWEDNPEYGRYEADFRLRPDAANPDLIVWYNESVDCPGRNPIGCAPRLNDTHQVRTPQSIQIRFSERRTFRQDRTTLVHEFGHVLGLGHCVEPYWAMAHQEYCDGAGLSVTDMNERPFTFRDRTLRVHVNLSAFDEADRPEARAQVGHALDFFNDTANGTVPADVRLVPIDSRYRADVRIRARESCRSDRPVCYVHASVDPDSDGAVEYRTGASIGVVSRDTEVVGWYVGWALAQLLTPDDIPPEFVDPTQDEVRSDWWN